MPRDPPLLEYRSSVRARLAIVVAAGLAWTRPARAELADVRISEVSPGADGDPNTAFVELAIPASGACLFPTTRLELFAADGTGLGASALVDTATCLGGPAWLLLTSPDGATHWGVGRDGGLTLALPRAAGQLCLVSTATRYDCVRWGPVTAVIPDFDSSTDMTSAAPLAFDSGLARNGDTGVVADDFALAAPTPRAPNDGSIFIPPDASLLPDAPPPPDASPFDAAPLPDAAPLLDATRPDARTNPPWLLADPGVGGCSISHRPPHASRLTPLALAPLLLLYRRRRP